MIFNFKDTTDAKTLGGHEASYFAPKAELNNKTALKAELLNTSILEKAVSLPMTELGVYEYALGGTDYTGADLPNVTYSYGNATIYVRYGFKTVFLWGIRGVAPIFNCYATNTGEWSGWQTLATTADLAKYLPLTGGYLEKNSANDVDLGLKNTVRDIRLRTYANGYFALTDVANNKSIISSTTDGTNTFNGTATGNLPLSGGTVTSNTSKPIKVNSTSSVRASLIEFLISGVEVGSLGIKDGVPMFANADWSKEYQLHHDGNSAKVHIGTTAPLDTSSLWIDTSA